MNCPNCKLSFVEEKAGKFLCSVCGWLEKVGKEWKSCEAPESAAPQESPPEPVPAALDPDPAALEPNPAALEPDPKCSVKEYLGGFLTVTEVDG